MGQRNSGYSRQEADNYATPNWVTGALLPHIPDRVRVAWEPASGEGAMARVLCEHLSPRRGGGVLATDIRPGNGMPTSDLSIDFLDEAPALPPYQAIVSNPPFNLAQKFIERALELTAPGKGFVAMLLRTDYDHAKGRRHLFADNPAFAKRIVLTKRIVWFVDPLTGRPKASPSENHAWLCWDHTHSGPAQIAYYVEDGLGDKNRQRLPSENRQENRQGHAGERPQGRPGETGCLDAVEKIGIE